LAGHLAQAAGLTMRPTYHTASALADRDARRRSAADAAMAAAYMNAERIAQLLDRHAGDAGDDAEACRAIADKLAALEREIFDQFGEPLVRFAGGWVPRSYIGGRHV
jgi:hypothetical protein